MIGLLGSVIFKEISFSVQKSLVLDRGKEADFLSVSFQNTVRFLSSVDHAKGDLAVFAGTKTWPVRLIFKEAVVLPRSTTFFEKQTLRILTMSRRDTGQDSCSRSPSLQWRTSTAISASRFALEVLVFLRDAKKVE